MQSAIATSTAILKVTRLSHTLLERGRKRNMSSTAVRLTGEQFAALAVEEFDVLHGLARRLTGNVGDADDLVQETYLRAFRFQDRFQLEHFGIRPWLVRILRNAHFSALEAAQCRPAPASSDRDGPSQPLHSEAGLSATVDRTWAEEMDQRLVRAVNDLPEEYRDALLLWAIDGMAYAEVATVMSVPVGTAFSRVHRARKRLAERLCELAAEYGIPRQPRPGGGVAVQ